MASESLNSNKPTLLTLPDHVLSYSCGFLSTTNLSKLSCTCKALNNISKLQSSIYQIDSNYLACQSQSQSQTDQHQKEDELLTKCRSMKSFRVNSTIDISTYFWSKFVMSTFNHLIELIGVLPTSPPPKYADPYDPRWEDEEYEEQSSIYIDMNKFAPNLIKWNARLSNEEVNHLPKQLKYLYGVKLYPCREPEKTFDVLARLKAIHLHQSGIAVMTDAMKLNCIKDYFEKYFDSQAPHLEYIGADFGDGNQFLAMFLAMNSLQTIRSLHVDLCGFAAALHFYFKYKEWDRDKMQQITLNNLNFLCLKSNHHQLHQSSSSLKTMNVFRMPNLKYLEIKSNCARAIINTLEKWMTQKLQFMKISGCLKDIAIFLNECIMNQNFVKHIKQPFCIKFERDSWNYSDNEWEPKFADIWKKAQLYVQNEGVNIEMWFPFDASSGDEYKSYNASNGFQVTENEKQFIESNQSQCNHCYGFLRQERPKYWPID
eukprot:245726_1